MAKKKPLIPFSLTPASWGLRGDSRRIAEAEYLYTDEDLDFALAEIKFEGRELEKELARLQYKWRHIDEFSYEQKLLQIDGKGSDEEALLDLALKFGRMDEYDYDVAKTHIHHRKTGKEREIALLEVERKHHRIDEYDADVAIVTLQFEEGTERDLALLELRKKFGKITDHEYEKEKATLEEEPWIAVIDSGFDPQQGINGVYFEFDWNEHWITYLRLNGYTGPTDASVVDAWFTDVCRAQGLATTQGNPFEPVPFSGRF